MQLFTDYALSTIAIGTRRPQFSWTVPLKGRGRRQTAYQIMVASSPESLRPGFADLWDSGRVESGQSVNIEYGGAELPGNIDCFWTVRLWDEAGKTIPASPVGYFGTPLFDPDDWQGDWIGLCSPDEPFSDPDSHQLDRVTPEVAAFEPDTRAPMLRKEWFLGKPVKRARAFVCGLGLFELRINGSKVGNDVLATPRTGFRKRVLYNTYDVTEQLVAGENVIGLLLGNGWFNGQKKYWGWQMQWHGSPRGIVQIEIEFTDGTTQTVVSDTSWKGDWSPITFNCLFDGEEYDARLEQPGWDTAGFDDSGWRDVNHVPAPGGALMPVPHEPERVVAAIRPVSVKEPEPGVFVFDLGKNITGWVRLTVEGGEPGAAVTLRFGEAQYENGALNAASNNAARQRDRYTLKGAEKEVFEPRFTFHGFQFVEVTGYPGTPDLDRLTGCFVRTAVQQTGTFECGNDLINRIHRCTLQSQLCNVQMGVPTDDTQRPERQGWGADAWGTANEALYNLWMPRVYRKWIQDFVDHQDEDGLVGMITPQAGANEDLVWSAAFVLIPWWQYLHCGDRRILEETYPALRRYVAFLERTGVKEVALMSSSEVVAKMHWVTAAKTRMPAEEDRGHLQISQWGDHLSTAEGFIGRANTPLSIATAFYYLDIVTMADIAGVLRRTEDAERYAGLAEKVKSAFNAAFYNADLGYYDTGTQSAQAWPLAFGLVPDEQRRRVINYFVRGVGHVQRRLTTGYIGTKFAIQVLSACGHDDLVWKLATSTEYPSWGYMLRLNRTTSCERWDGEGGSLNHAPLGAAIDEWFYWGLAGIRPDSAAPGYEKIVFRPYMPAELTWAQASVQTVRGRIRSAWRKDGSRAALEVEVPANSSATVYIPVGDCSRVTENGLALEQAEGVSNIDADDNETRLTIGSGTYVFEFPAPGLDCG